MPQKVPFHYPFILAAVSSVIILLIVMIVGGVMEDDPEVTPTTEVVSSLPEVVDTTGDTDVEPTAEPANTDIPPTPEPTIEPTEIASSTDTLPDNVDDSTDTSTQYDPALVEEGEIVYNTTCLACHGVGARGVPGLGKDLLESEFVRGLTDAELHDFVVVGRPVWDAENTTGVDMPAKGGNPALTDDQIIAIIAYIRTEDANVFGTSQPESDASTEDSSSTTEDISTTAAFDPALVEEGEMVFIGACSACHGMGAVGIDGLGKPLIDSEFIQTHTNEELVDFVNVGRPIWDAENTTGVDMPAKGGNPALTNDQIIAIVNYIRSLNQ